MLLGLMLQPAQRLDEHMRALLALSRVIDLINEKVGKVTAWAILVAVLVSAINAIVRKVFGASSNAWLELQWYLFGAVFMLCASWTLRDNEHIRIDIIANRFTKRGRDRMDVFGHILFLFPFIVLMVWTTWPFFWRSYESQEISTNAGGLIIWPAKALILAGFIMLGAQGLSELIKRIAILRGDIEDTTPGGGHHSAVEAETERLLAVAGEAPPGQAPKP